MGRMACLLSSPIFIPLCLPAGGKKDLIETIDSDYPHEFRKNVFKIHVAKLVPASQRAMPIELPDTLSDDCLSWAKALEPVLPDSLPRAPPKTPPQFRQLHEDLSKMKKTPAKLISQNGQLEKKLGDL